MREALVERLQLGVHGPVIGDHKEVDLPLQACGDEVRVDAGAAAAPGQVNSKPSEERLFGVVCDGFAEENLDMRCCTHLVPARSSGAGPSVARKRCSDGPEPHCLQWGSLSLRERPWPSLHGTVTVRGPSPVMSTSAVRGHGSQPFRRQYSRSLTTVPRSFCQFSCGWLDHDGGRVGLRKKGSSSPTGSPDRTLSGNEA